MQASREWGISESRLSTLCAKNMIDGAIRKNDSWLIPVIANAPDDARESYELALSHNLNESYFKDIDDTLQELKLRGPMNEYTLRSINEDRNLRWIYNSNAIEGNTLTLRETQIILKGITIGGKSVKDHLEVVNHKDAIFFLEELVNAGSELTERDIKDLHSLILKGIDQKNAGKYRNANVIISGARHVPPQHYLLQELMSKLINKYQSWHNLHPVVRAAYLHGEFVKIHPFIDGNGRTSRLLMNFELMKAGYLPIIILQETRNKYYDALDKAHTTFDYTDFIKMIADYEIETIKFYLSMSQ
jgi:Fic family protein